MLFARDVTGPLSSLLKQFDAAVAKHKEADLRSFAVFLTEDAEAIEAKLKTLAEKEKISESVPLTIVEDVAGPEPYKINKDAEVTVILYNKGKVVSNFAYKAGQMKEKDVKTIAAAIPKLLEDDEKAKRELDALKKKLEEKAKDKK
jgi:K+ transporter